jgi:hypothetical protein
MRKVVVASISVALATTTGGCASYSTGTVLIPHHSCALRSADFSELADVLNSAETCYELACLHGSWGGSETKELAGGSLSNWLWFQPTPRTITFKVADEIKFRNEARKRAIAVLPAGKTLVQIEYFTDRIGPNQSIPLVLGARAYYGACGGSPT